MSNLLVHELFVFSFYFTFGLPAPRQKGDQSSKTLTGSNFLLAPVERYMSRASRVVQKSRAKQRATCSNHTTHSRTSSVLTRVLPAAPTDRPICNVRLISLYPPRARLHHGKHQQALWPASKPWHPTHGTLATPTGRASTHSCSAVLAASPLRFGVRP